MSGLTNNSSSSGGLGSTGVLFLIFLVLKLVHVINWSWWWVTSPLWVGAALVLLVIGITLIVITLNALWSKGEL